MPRKKSKKKKFPFYIKYKNRFLGIFFVFLSVIILTYPSAIKYTQEKNPIRKASEFNGKQTAQGPIPDRVIIPDVKIDTKIKEAKIENGYWQVFENTASYGLGSAYLGQKGNIVIFAHAREGLFYNLKSIKEGDLVFVYSKNKKYTYGVKTITSVYPNETKIIGPTENEILTLYTCSGFYDEKRLIIIAEPVNLENKNGLTF